MALQEELEDQGNFLFKYRSYLPLLFCGAGMCVFLLIDTDRNAFERGCTYVVSCFCIGLFGLLIRVWTVGHTPVNTSGRNTSEGQLADELNTSGIYSLVRHPLYLGNYFMWLSVCLLTANLAFILIFSCIYFLYYERIMFAEEAFLRRKFQSKYIEWAQGVPAFFPNLRGYISPNYAFSYKKVLKKEKNGIAALVLLFYLFEILSQYKIFNSFEFKPTILFYASVAFLILYLILKAIKKFTTLLEEEGR